MMKKLIRFMTACAVLFMSVINSYSVVFAEENAVVVFDYAGLMSETENMELQTQTIELSEKTGWDIFLVTTDDAEGKTASAYAEDFYVACTEEDSDGILILMDMDNRELYMSTNGEAIRYLTDDRIEDVLDAGYGYITEGNYADCFSEMLNSVDYYYEKGVEEYQYNYDVETGAVSEYRVLTGTEAVLSFVVAVGTGILIYFGIKKSYRIHGTKYEYPYQKYGKMNLTAQEDRFIRQHVTHRRIETDNNRGSSGSSGRSSVHTGSSGRSHGGGGRKF